MRKSSMLVLLVFIVALSGCLGNKNVRQGKLFKSSKSVKSSKSIKSACTSYSTKYDGALLTVSNLAQKKLNKCATITGLHFDAMAKGFEAHFGSALTSQGMSDWMTAILRPDGKAETIHAIFHPRLSNKVAVLKIMQKMILKGKFVSNHIGRKTLRYPGAESMNPQIIIVYDFETVEKP